MHEANKFLSIATSLDLSTGGAFARALAAWGQTAAFSDGSTPFMTSFGVNARRLENRGDGNGICLLMEKASTNKWQYGRNLYFGTFPGNGPDTVTNDVATGPDGTVLADRDQVPIATYGSYQALTFAINNQLVATSYQRMLTGTGNGQPAFSNGDSTSKASVSTPLTTTYQRLELQINETAFRADAVYVPADGRSDWGGTAQALDVVIDMMQVENSYYPTSFIDTTSAVTRPQDTLSYTTGNYPALFLTDGVVIQFCPDCSSTEFLASGEQWAFIANGAGFNDGVFMYNDGGSVALGLNVGGTEIATIEPFTWSRGQKLTITAKPSAGSLTLSGATTGNGTIVESGGPWTSGQTLYIGNTSAGLLPVTGRYVGPRITVATTPFAPLIGYTLWTPPSAITLAGSNVASITNVGGAGGAFSAAGSARPGIVTIDGKVVPLLDGVDDVLSGGPPAIDVIDPGGLAWSIWWVVRADALIGAVGPIYDGAQMLSDVGGNFSPLVFDANGVRTGFNSVATAPIPISTGVVYIARATYDGSKISLLMNGISESFSTSASVSGLGFALAQRMGENYNGAAFFTGAICETIAYNFVLSGPQIALVEAYLRNQYPSAI
jgi:hypothetical protein